MRRFAKFVAVLLVMLSAMPALAVAPCRQAMHSMKCCSSDCPMMAKPTGATLAGGTGLEITRPLCSGPSSQQATSLATQTMTENSWELVVFHNHSAGSLIPVAETRVLLATPKDPPLCPVSRTALCSFLI